MNQHEALQLWQNVPVPQGGGAYQAGARQVLHESGTEPDGGMP